MMKQRFEYELFADFWQFYLQDGNSDEWCDWTREAGDRLLAVAPGVIGVGTVRSAIVPLVVEIVDGEPNDDMDSWDQVNECTIKVPSGRIVIAGCTDDRSDAAQIRVLPGSYRARIHYGNLYSRSADGLDGDDYYKVILWRAAPSPLRVSKQVKQRFDLFWPTGGQLCRRRSGTHSD